MTRGPHSALTTECFALAALLGGACGDGTPQISILPYPLA
jgi:hypothetical protein